MNMQSIKMYTFKNKALVLFSLLFVLFFSSCEDVVNLDLETADPKLVIDAEIIWKKGTSGNEQTIKISKTAPYYNNTTPKVSGARVLGLRTVKEMFLLLMKLLRALMYVRISFLL